MFVTAAPPVTELLQTVMRVLNECSRFYPHANRNMAENLIVRREVAVDSVHRLGQNAQRTLPLELPVRQIQYLLHRWEMFAV